MCTGAPCIVTAYTRTQCQTGRRKMSRHQDAVCGDAQQLMFLEDLQSQLRSFISLGI